MNAISRTTFIVLAVRLALPAAAKDGPKVYDVVVYGGTSSGVAASIQAARMKKSVVVIEPGKHVGGLTAGGLGWTDSGNKTVIGGISREFYQRIKKHYDQPVAWKFVKASQYKRYRPKDDAMWTFEPNVAETIYREMLSEHKIPVVFGERLDRKPGGVRMVDGAKPPKIASIRMESGLEFQGRVFIDATYEGDLMAGAGVTFTVGREAAAKYSETLNGVQRKLNTHSHRFLVRVDPYVEPGKPSSGLLHGIDRGPYPNDGAGDHRVQAYCFRMCMSNIKSNRVPFPKPDDYDESKYELLFRNFEAGDLRLPLKPDMMPNGKTDTNNNCAVSTDYVGQNYDYPKASYARRAEIIRRHRSYQMGLMWTLANHPRVPQTVRDKMAPWGLAKDEFTDNGHWPHQIYVREARRMVSDYVLCEGDCRRLRTTPQSVGMGSYNMDSHNCMRYVTPEGAVQNEGDVQVSPGGPYQISYRSIVPASGQATNLIVPVCVSSSHIAYGSIRMEPVFMVLGQSAATAACLSLDHRVAVQEVDYKLLRERLVKDGQVLEYHGPVRTPNRGIDPGSLKGLVIDDSMAKQKGAWLHSTSVAGFVGRSYAHDGNENKGQNTITFAAQIPESGMYEVRFAYTANPNRATNVPVTIHSADGAKMRVVNQRKHAPVDGTWVSLGRFRFEKGKAQIIVSNQGTDGYVIADALQLLRAAQ